MRPDLFKDEKAINLQEDRRKQSQKNRIYLNKLVLDELEEIGYIKITKAGRHNKIEITESGKQIAYLIGKC
jgi:ribosomal protein S19E (S16A)